MSDLINTLGSDLAEHIHAALAVEHLATNGQPLLHLEEQVIGDTILSKLLEYDEEGLIPDPTTETLIIARACLYLISRANPDDNLNSEQNTNR